MVDADSCVSVSVPWITGMHLAWHNYKYIFPVTTVTSLVKTSIVSHPVKESCLALSKLKAVLYCYEMQLL